MIFRAEIISLTMLLLVWLFFSQAYALSTCPPLYKNYLGTCLRAFSTPSTRDSASATCQAEGGSLAIITDYNNMDFVKSLVANAQYMWIGMQCVGNTYDSCITDEGKRYAADGSFFLPAGIQEPTPTMPNYLMGKDGSWMANDGSYYAPFVCQLSDAPAFRCDNGFNLLNGWCYKSVQSSMTESQAESNCVSMGGHLASLHSQAESQAVADLYGSSASWIGLVNYRWTDGTPLDYQNGGSSGSGCTYLDYYGNWHNSDCSVSRYSICKKDVIPTTSSYCPSSDYIGTGRIFSPAYPQNYPSQTCQYVIRGTLGLSIKLQFNRIYLDYNANIYLFNDPYAQGAFAVINSYTTNASVYYSTSNYLRVIFDSSSSSPADIYRNVWFADYSSVVAPSQPPQTTIIPVYGTATASSASMGTTAGTATSGSTTFAWETSPGYTGTTPPYTGSIEYTTGTTWWWKK